jgi:predicted O-linked N-acetylglucosamine transferase (SPINDLY family)
VYLSSNKYEEAKTIFRGLEMEPVSLALDLISTILDPSSPVTSVSQRVARCKAVRPHGGDYFLDLALSFGCRSLGNIKEAIEYLPKTSNDITSQEFKLNNAVDLAINLSNLYSIVSESCACHFLEEKNYSKAVDLFISAIEATPTRIELLVNFAVCRIRQSDYIEAENILKIVSKLDPSTAVAYYLIGRIYELSNQTPEESYDMYRKAYSLDPGSTEYGIAACKALIRKKDWSSLKELTEGLNKDHPNEHRFLSYKGFAEANNADLLSLIHTESSYQNLGIRPDTIADPFIGLLFDPSASNQLLRAKQFVDQTITYSTEKDPEIARELTPIVVDKNFDATAERKINIGIFSADFCNHAGMSLMLNLIKSFDHEMFNLIIFDMGTIIKDSVTSAIAKWSTKYIDCEKLGLDVVREIARSLPLDIAIDRGGHTGRNRLSIFAERLAPVQVSYLAYPSTTGASFIDYIIGDSVVTPVSNYSKFSELVITLPMCYQPNSRHLLPAITYSDRPRELPEGKFVLANFNQITKLRVKDFEVWANILGQSENTILWLIDDNLIAEQNVRKFFENKKINPERIVFSRKIPWVEHQSRIQHADLCLDSHIYGSHTTATDILGAGLPIVTLPGDGFQTRVCASILKDLGLKELVTDSWTSYEALAIDLIKNPTSLRQLKERITSLMDRKQIERRAADYRNKWYRAMQVIHKRRMANEKPCPVIIE